MRKIMAYERSRLVIDPIRKAEGYIFFEATTALQCQSASDERLTADGSGAI
jgi:hypothetical protein